MKCDQPNGFEVSIMISNAVSPANSCRKKIHENRTQSEHNLRFNDENVVMDPQTTRREANEIVVERHINTGEAHGNTVLYIKMC